MKAWKKIVEWFVAMAAMVMTAGADPVPEQEVYAEINPPVAERDWDVCVGGAAREPQAETGNRTAEREAYVAIDSLIEEREGDVCVNYAMRCSQVVIGDYTAEYEAVEDASADRLRESLGASLEGNEGWYRVSGHEEPQYLICVSGEESEYTLWKFAYFLEEEYPYSDVLRLIYGIETADELRAVSVTAANMDNSDEGKRIQEEIGEYEVTDPSDLKKLFDILVSMTCRGHNHWELIDYGQSDTGMTESVRLGRYLTLETADGARIDSLKYTAVSGMFYEYGGVAYERLSQEERETADAVLRIEKAGEDTPDSAIFVN